MTTPQPPAKSEDEELREKIRKIVGREAWLYSDMPHRIETLIKQEAEAHATKHLLDLIGPNEPVDGYSKDLNRSVRPASRNEVRDELRAKIEAWAGGVRRDRLPNPT